MLKRVICILVLVFSCSVFGQNYIKHTVAAGETITQIAQKYKVTPYDIYRLNPDSQNGIQLNAVLLIPKSLASEVKPKSAVVSETKTHTVVAKETLYSISKKYNITIEDLEVINPILKTDGLQPGQVLTISSDPKFAFTLKKAKLIEQVTHEVQPKETKYGIATKYGITVDELEKQNPEVKDNLPIGYVLKINTPNSNKEVVNSNPKEPTPKNEDNTIEYIVKQGETLYSLSKLFNLTQQRLTDLNPELNNGVIEGMTLKLPPYAAFAKKEKDYVDLTTTLFTKNRKKLVLLLPFNASKIERDTVTSMATRLSKDKFLNMTLEFYSGALMAIDSAKTLGLNIDVSIYDSEETKNSSHALNVIKSNHLENSDAIIGPFYQDNVEEVAAYLEDKNVPVISPLSKDYAKSYKNLYQSMPPFEATKNAMFNYMRSKNGNIIAVINPKKVSIKQYLDENQSNIKMVGLSEKGTFVSDSISKHFVKDRMNYVVMESETTSTIFTVTSTMLKAAKDYQVQLVILSDNPTLDFEEIDLSRLTKLNMIYPTLTNDIQSPRDMDYERDYKQINKAYPSAYATRGFDLTLDTMLRLSQEKSFEETIETMATEQIENKFDYTKKIDGGYMNKGTYILYYDTDLNINKAQ